MTDNSPAFPQPCNHPMVFTGMTLRDYFAAAALPGIERYGAWPASHWAEKAYEIADAMLEHRERKP